MDIGVVIVTYNRIEKLRTALRKFDEQQQLPKYIIVVNNASTDGTEGYLTNWKKAEDARYRRVVLDKDENDGGSGGFFAGLSAAANENAEWIWVSDDDAFPRKDALKNAKKFISSAEQSGDEKIAAVCALVMNHNKPDKYQSRSFFTRGIRICERFAGAEEFCKSEFEKNTLTYVGSIINVNKLKLVGMPKKDYFIYYDDTEHGMRLAKTGKIICRTDVIVDHDSQDEAENQVTWKTYYCFRNMTDMYRKHFGGAYFAYFAFKVNIKILYNRLTGNKNLKIRILETAYKDALAGRFGMNEIYKPGWKP